MKIPVKVRDKRGRGEVANLGYDKKNMSKTWSVIMYSSIGLVTAAAVFVAGRITGLRSVQKQNKAQPQPNSQVSEVANA